MIRMYFLTIYLFLGCLLFNAQAPCSDFNATTSPLGNWHPDPVNSAVSSSVGSPNTLDGSQYLILDDLSGGSWFVNTTDYKNLGQRFLGQCLYFDFYLEKDGGFNAPIHPTIYIISGDKIITFVANITVTPNSGWVRVRAPIANATATSFPSNAEGTWSMVSAGTWTDFNNVMNNSTAVMISPDITSSPSERVYFDNICVKSCDGCTADFKLDTSFASNSNAASVKLTLINPILVSTPNNPGSTYTVNWGDGTSSPYTLSALTHNYSNPGTYTICVTEKQGRLTLCTRCFTFCYSKASVPSKDINAVNTTPQFDIRAIGQAELSTNNDYKLVPNPAKTYVDIQTNLSARGPVSIRVIDMSGKIVLEKSEALESGRQTIKLNTENLIQGSYIVEIKSANKTNSQKLLISK